MDADRKQALSDALNAVRARIDAACSAAGRERDEVTLLPVTKFFPASDVALLHELGCTDFGESREQEASAKVRDVGAEGLSWHMIGRVQRNKAKSVAAWARSVQSADSVRLVDALGKAAASALGDGVRSAPLDVLVQVSVDGDVHRGGVPREDLRELTDRVAATDALHLAGLMAVAPLGSDPARAFADLEALHDAVLRDHPGARVLSAGMTGDLEDAVAHGSTCVRVGTAIMGPRPITSP